jgi:hydrogenase maturation protease
MKVLVAGIGNVFLGDDGFGVEVALRLLREPWPPGIEVVDAGIRGMHLAYRLLEGYDLLVAIDAVARGGEPGTVYVIEPEVEALPAGEPDAHSISLPSVLAMVRALGGRLGRVLLVGCEPAHVGEQLGLSAAVEAAVGPAAWRVRQIAEGAMHDEATAAR